MEVEGKWREFFFLPNDRTDFDVRHLGCFGCVYDMWVFGLVRYSVGNVYGDFNYGFVS